MNYAKVSGMSLLFMIYFFFLKWPLELLKSSTWYYSFVPVLMERHLGTSVRVPQCSLTLPSVWDRHTPMYLSTLPH